ncbi:LysR substrate-binding domain-containing protein [Rhodococcus olei]|uniref:LysR substrate-binding domain-containing protein n=1 Tax=Rhodococcus olei TaxID=2161675 RepID=A0ABP8P6P5_9NOCA
MDVRQLEYFLAVVDNGGVNRAAAALHVAQPSLSQSIRKLEKDLRTQLFHRVGRGLVLAPAGEALVGPARQVLRDLASAREAVREVRDVERGRIDIAGLSDMSTDPLSVWVAQFRLKNPRVSLRVAERDQLPEVIELVKSGDCELGVTVLPVPQEGLVHEFLIDQRFVLVLPPGSGAELPDPLPLGALAGIPLVMGERNSASRTYIEGMLRSAGVVPTIAVEVPQRGAVVPMLMAGAGAAILPLRIAVDARQRGAVVRELAPCLVRQIGVIHRPDWLTEVAEAFLRQTREGLASWNAAIDRRMATGMTHVEAAASTVAAIEKRQIEEFLSESPLRIEPDGPEANR